MAWFDSRTLFVSASLFCLPLLVVCAILCLPILAFATVGLYLLAWTIYLLWAQTDAKFNLPYNPTRVIKINIAFLGLITGWISEIPLVITYFHWRYWVVRNYFHKFVSRNIAYSDAHPLCRLDVYKSKNSGQLSPIIVFIYGGSWSSGNKYMYTPLANTLRELGYTVVVPDYRKYPLVKIEPIYDDVRRAIKWAFEHGREHGGDPNSIYVMGHSAGAQLATYVVLKDVIAKAKYTKTGGLNVRENGSLAKHNPTDGVSATGTVMRHLASQKANTDGLSYDFLPQIEGLLLMAGVYSIEKHLEHEKYRGVEKVSAMARVMGSTKHGYEANSPIDLVRANKELFESAESIVDFLPRIMFIHGEKDAVVPMEQSVDMYNMLGQVLPPERRDDVDVSMRLYKRLNHAQCVTALMPSFIKTDRVHKSLIRDFTDFIGVSAAALPSSSSSAAELQSQ